MREKQDTHQISSLITRLRYPVAEYASRLDCPVLVVHSRDDEIIPFEMGQSIYAAVKQHKSFLELRGDHNNGFFISRHDYVAGLDDFIESVLSPEGESGVCAGSNRNSKLSDS